MDKEVIPDLTRQSAFYLLMFLSEDDFENGLTGCIIGFEFSCKSSACVVSGPFAHSVDSNYSHLQYCERVTLTLFLLVHFCNPISAPDFVTAADLAALLSFNQNTSFLCDAVLPPHVRSAEFSSSP